MLNFGIINNYSCVLINLYKSNKVIAQESINTYHVIKNNIQLLNILHNKLISNDKKITALQQNINLEHSKKFFELIIKNNRSEYLLPIIQLFLKKYEEYEHIGRVKLIVARNISDENQSKIITFIKNKFGFLHIYLDIVCDKSLIGGFVAYVNNIKYDCSIKNSLRKLYQKFNTNM